MKKRLVAVVLILSMILSLFPANSLKAAETKSTEQSCGDNLTWSYNSGTLTISGTGRMYDYTTVNNFTSGITTDVPWESYMDDIVRVTIGDGVTYIGKCAFADCVNIRNIDWGSSLKEIGEYAFARSVVLQVIVLPEGVERIGKWAFAGCTGIRQAVLPSTVREIEERAFSGCSGLQTVNLPEGLETIGYAAFIVCNNLKIVNYAGTQAKWEAISIGEYNECLQNATINYETTDVGEIEDGESDDDSSTSTSVNVETNKAQYYCAMGQKFKVEITIRTEETYVEGSHKYIGWLAVMRDGGWEEINSWYNNGGVVKYTFTLDSNDFGMGNYLFAASVFPSDNFASGASLCDRFFHVKFIDSSFNLNLDVNGGECDTSSVPVIYNCEYGELPVPTRIGYTFSGWYTDPVAGTKVKEDSIVTAMEDHTVYAQWKANQYLVILNVGRGTCQPASAYVTYDDTYSILDTVTVSEVEDYTFEGWYTSADGGEKVTSSTKVQLPANHVLYGRWKEVEKPEIYTITYDANGGSGAPEEQYKTEGVNLKLRTVKPTRPGYRFLGWSTSSTATKAAYSAGGTYSKDVSDILYAVWYKYKTQTITASSKKVVYGSKAFNLNAKTSGNGKLTYTSSNKKVATVSSTGKITIKGYGKTTIKITAAATTTHKKGTKSITITVVPKKGKVTKLSSPSAKKVSVKWQKDATVTGYQMYISRSSSFNKQTVQRTYKKTVGSMSLKGLTSKKYYYIKIRSYKTVDGTRYYGAWSAVKKIKIK